MTHPTDHLRRYAEDVASSVSPARSRVAALRAIGGTSLARSSLVPRLAFASLAAFLVLNVAAAGVADAAVPGDLLYPLDRAYEAIADAVGLGEERTTERVDEAWALVERDDLSGAIELMATEVSNASVHDVAAQMQAVGPENGVSAEHVQNLLANVRLLAIARGDHDSEAWEEAMAAIDLVGEQVSAPAQDEGNEPELPAPAQEPGPPDQADPQGPPSEPGQPDSEQGSENPGQGSLPDNAGEQGPPPDPGPPDDAGEQGAADDSDNQALPDRPDNQGSGGGNQSNQGQSGGRR